MKVDATNVSTRVESALTDQGVNINECPDVPHHLHDILVEAKNLDPAKLVTAKNTPRPR